MGYPFAVASVPVSLSILTGDFSPTNATTAALLFFFFFTRSCQSTNAASGYKGGMGEDTEKIPSAAVWTR